MFGPAVCLIRYRDIGATRRSVKVEGEGDKGFAPGVKGEPG